MLSLNTFKESLGLKTITTKKSKTGKVFLDVPGISAYISPKANLNLPLFITECTTTDGKGKVLVVCNQGWTASDVTL